LSEAGAVEKIDPPLRADFVEKVENFMRQIFWQDRFFIQSEVRTVMTASDALYQGQYADLADPLDEIS